MHTRTDTYADTHTYAHCLLPACNSPLALLSLALSLTHSIPLTTHSLFFVTMIAPTRTLLDADMTDDEVTALNLGKEWTVRAL